jgi:hypothetical protein
MRKVQDILRRMVAVFTVGALGTLGAGALLGIDTFVSLLMAGLLAVASVAERLAREYLDDGKLTLDEINDAFSPLSKNYDGLPNKEKKRKHDDGMGSTMDGEGS